VRSIPEPSQSFESDRQVESNADPWQICQRFRHGYHVSVQHGAVVTMLDDVAVLHEIFGVVRIDPLR
jgi:hypothetical protein